MGCLLYEINPIDSSLQSPADDLCYLGVLWTAVLKVGFSMPAAVDMRTGSMGIAVQAGVEWCEVLLYGLLRNMIRALLVDLKQLPC